jgi:hypothetical protein
MAASTGIVLTAGALAELDMVVNDWNPGHGGKGRGRNRGSGFRLCWAGQALAGWGTGLAVLLLLGAVLTNVPRGSSRRSFRPEEVSVENTVKVWLTGLTTVAVVATIAASPYAPTSVSRFKGIAGTYSAAKH